MAEDKAPGHDDITRLLGPSSDHSVVEILALKPTWEEIEVVAAYLAGETDVMGEERKPRSGNAGRILEIIRRDEAFDEERR